MSLEVKDIPAKLGPIVKGLSKYLVFIFIMTVMIIYGYLVFHINTLASQEPAEDAVAERLKTVSRPRIDEDTLTKIEQLEDQNIQVQTLFQQARDNPFTE